MAQHNSQQNNNLHGAHDVSDLLTPPLTVPANNQQQQQQHLPPQDIHVNNNGIGMRASQPTSVASWSSSMSFYSRSSQEKSADELYDKIEDMICEFMREPNRHYLHCRVLRWSLDDDLTQQFSAVIIINPPTTKNGLQNNVQPID